MESGLFAEVPHELVALRGLKPSVKVILTHCLVRYQTKKDDGKPWTFSAAGIAAETGLSEKTVGRHLGRLRSRGVLNLYGTMSDGEREYEVFTFSPEGLVGLIRTTAKTSVVMLRAANGDGATVETATDKLADNLSDNLSANLSDKTPPRREDTRREEGRREDDYNQGVVASSLGTSPPAEGGCCVGMASTTVAHSSDSTTIQYAYGNSNAGGKEDADSALVSSSAPMVQSSASGDANRGARRNGTGDSDTSATRAAGTKGIGLTDAELDTLVKETGCTREQLQRMENAALIEVIYGNNGSKPRNGFDSL